jgi:uncharacterized protein YegL
MNVYFILDRSASMRGVRWSNAIEGINAYINGLKAEKIEGRAKIVAFDALSKIELVTLYDGSIPYFEALAENTIEPRGNTPLYDAAGVVINEALVDNAERTVIVILTDGAENASKDYTQASIKDLTKKVQDKGWEVVFLGANFDVQQYAYSAGLDQTKFANFDITSRSATAYTVGNMAAQSVLYAKAGQAINLNN